MMGSNIMVEYIPPSLEAIAKLLDSTTVEPQANTAGKVLEKIVENLSGVSKEGVIDGDKLLEVLNGLSVNKDFSRWWGNLKSMEIRLGSTCAREGELV